MTRKIYSKDADYQKLEVLKSNRNKRYKYNEFFVEGVRNINEAIKNGWNISSFIFSHDRKLSGWAENILENAESDINYELPSALMAELSGKDEVSELLAVIKMRDDDLSKLKFSENPMTALFDRPSNKGNLGTIIRSCDALGVEALLLTGHSVDLYDPEVIASSMGSFFKVPVVRAAGNSDVESFITMMKKDYPGFVTIGTTSHRQKNISEIDMKKPFMFMIGNETDGLSRYYKDSCDVLGTIPMHPDSSASSFNVGCAATVLFYEASRQRSAAACV